MEKISSTDRMRNEEVSQRVKKTRNILHPITRKKANTIGHILRRNCLLRHVIQRKITGRREVTGRRRRRSMQPLDDLNDTRGYWKLKQKASDRTQLGSSSERGYGPGVWQTTKWKNDFNYHYKFPQNERHCTAMVSKIILTTHNCSEMNRFGITQPAVVGSVVSGVPRNFVRGGSTNSVEDRENRDLEAVAP